MKNKVYIKFSTTYGFKHPLGLRMYSPWIRRNYSNRLIMVSFKISSLGIIY